MAVATFTRASETTTEREELKAAIKNGNAGNLTIGKILHKRYERGSTIEHLEAWLATQGLRLPSEGTRSKYRSAYEAWIRNAGMEIGREYYHPNFTDGDGQRIPMRLEGVSTYSLYEARDLINRVQPEETLAFVFNNPIEVVRDAASDKKERRAPGEGLRSLPKVPEGVHDSFKQFCELLPGKTRLEALEFVIVFMSDLAERDRSVFDQAVNAYFGEADNAIPETWQTQETQAAVQAVQ